MISTPHYQSIYNIYVHTHSRLVSGSHGVETRLTLLGDARQQLLDLSNGPAWVQPLVGGWEHIKVTYSLKLYTFQPTLPLIKKQYINTLYL